MLKKILCTLLATAVLIVLAGSQILSVDMRANTDVTSTPAIGISAFGSQATIPASVQLIFQNACLDCHSNQTRWPWYSRIPPASWLVERDVDHGRRAMNLSEWKTQTGNRAVRIAGFLTAACADVQSGRMPPPQYRLIHHEANLSTADKAAFCVWTTGESRRVLNVGQNGSPRLAQLKTNSPTNQD
jgi:hypothetical protein